MKFIDSLLIFSLLIVGIYGATLEFDLPTPRPGTDLPPADITKRKTTTTTTTVSTTTPTQVPTTSTVQPTSSSSVAPITTTTSAPSTTKATTTPTTTAKPIVPSTPSPKPSEPEASNWTLTEGNRTCILVEFATQLNVSYLATDTKLRNLVYNIPKDPESIVTGTCGNGTSDQYILIKWKDNNAFNALNMTFKLNHTTNEFTMNKLAFELDKAIFPDDANLSSYSYYYVGSTFATPKQNSYHCTRPQTLNLTNSEFSINSTGTLSMSHTLLEAYHEGKSKQFSTSIDCDAISTPDIVPIAVGIALIALVIIVLIAYVIGRRRSQAHGYVSM